MRITTNQNQTNNKPKHNKKKNNEKKNTGKQTEVEYQFAFWDDRFGFARAVAPGFKKIQGLYYFPDFLQCWTTMISFNVLEPISLHL